MQTRNVHAVTGAFGFSGRHIARRLLRAGLPVRTLTSSPHGGDDLAGQIAIRPLDFSRPEQLVESLQDVDVLYNTYWVRFNHANFSHAQAVQNTKVLFRAAVAAGVRRIVHISITNPSLESDLEYFRGKAELEEALKATGISYGILRPAVIFGPGDILINNIAWALRHLPVFGIFGDGQYRICPIEVGDLADLAVRQGKTSDNVAVDAIGPECFTFGELVTEIRRIIGARTPIIRLPPGLGYWFVRALGLLLRDVILTREEIRGLMENRLYVASAPVASTKFTDWAAANAAGLGRHYANELARRRR